MSVEQVARDFIFAMYDTEKAKAYLTADAIAGGGELPQPMPAAESLNVTKALLTAFPDIKFDVEQVITKGNEATMNVQWSGTNTGPFNMPGMPGIPPTGKKVSVRDMFIVTVQGDKVSKLWIESPAGGGIPGALAQLGVQMPGM